jgi:hypothetical protein
MTDVLYRIETLCGSDWDPVNEEMFATYKEARGDLEDFLNAQHDAHDKGYMDTKYNPADWRVAEVPA